MSKKLNAKAVREETRKQVAAKYKKDVEHWKKLAQDRWNNYIDATKRLADLHDENGKLKEQLAAQKEWIERLMEFIDMPDEQRHDAVKKYIQDRKMREDFKALFEPYFKLLNRMNLIF